MNESLNENNLEIKKTEAQKQYLETMMEDVEYKKAKRKNNIFIIIIIFIVIIATVLIIRMQINQHKQVSAETMKENFEEMVTYIIDTNYNKLQFEGNKAIVTLEDLYKGTYGVSLGTSLFDSETEHQCMGYITITKNNDKHTIDSSHYCDMYDN